MKKHIGKIVIISIWILCAVGWYYAINFTDAIEAWAWYYTASTAMALVLLSGATLFSLVALLRRW